MARLSREFYLGDTVDIARRLLGTYLVRQLGKTVLVGRITETEAYIGRCDKACHAYGYHKTPRNAPMFLGPGHAYIYLIYGMHHCLNLVTEPEGEPAAVLIRALEPIAGEETIRRLRYGDKPMTPYRTAHLLDGPGKICRGLGLTTAENGMDLTGQTLFVCTAPADVGLADPPPQREIIVSGPRIGVDYAEEARDFPWRFRLKRRTAEGCFSLIWTEP